MYTRPVRDLKTPRFALEDRVLALGTRTVVDPGGTSDCTSRGSGVSLRLPDDDLFIARVEVREVCDGEMEEQDELEVAASSEARSV